MVSKKAPWLILFLILVLAAGLRLFALAQYPPGLNYDEVSHAYNAYSLLQTGRDQWGTAFPFPNFRAYGDYPTVLNLYLTVPAVALFGPTDFAARLPHAVAGILSVLVVYVLTRRWSGHKCLSLFTAFLFAVSPWTFFPSRAVFQSNWTVLLLTLALALYLSRRKFLSVLIFGLSLFAYHNTRIFVPLLLPFLLWPLRRHRRLLWAGLAVFLIAFGLLLNPQTRARSSWVGIVDSGAVAYLEQARTNTGLPPLLAKLVYNRPVYFISTVTRNYLGYFSPQFLFFSGGTQYQYSLPGFGLLNPALLPFFYLGIFVLAVKRRWLVLLWLALAPLPAAVTRDQFAVIRSTTMLPVVFLVTAFGLMVVSSRLQRIWHWLFWGAFLLLFCSQNYFSAYFSSYPRQYARDWQFGYREMVSFVKQRSADYDRIIITKYYAEPHEYLLWYWPWSPRAYQSDPRLSWDYHSDWYWVNRFAKFEFVNDWEMRGYVEKIDPQEHVLIVSSPQTPTLGLTRAVINFPDGQPAFIIKDL
jgi:4-amino-4-deoxy-L-arabinose transferase-like glycosyltransferase